MNESIGLQKGGFFGLMVDQYHTNYPRLNNVNVKFARFATTLMSLTPRQSPRQNQRALLLILKLLIL